MLRRIALLLEFCGTTYAGWQRQDNAIAVQNVLENALLDLLGTTTTVYGSSRTDAGVHARGMVCHFDTTSSIDASRFPYALRSKLPQDISILDAKEVPMHFHARFSSLGKQYSFYIWNKPMPSALLAPYSVHEPRPLAIDQMQKAAKMLEGEHDFVAFMAQGSSAKTTVRTLYQVRVEVLPNGLIRIVVKGNAFLYNMVRIIAGTLMYVGLGKIRVDDIRTRMLQGDRKQMGKTLGAQGLFLDYVIYPDEFALGWVNDW